LLSSYNTLFVGKVCHNLKKVESTNDFAMNLTKTEPVFEGTVVRTSHQFRGKGQMGNSWYSDPDSNLAVSVVLKPVSLNGGNMYLLNMAVALAAREFVAMYCNSVYVKWPNDIYIQDKKVAGILVENVWKGGKLLFSIIGLGINVNQANFPADIPNPTSMFLQTNQTIDLEEAYEKLIWQVEQWYMKFKTKPQEIKEQYLSKLLYFETSRTFTAEGKEVHGRIIDVSESGKLILMTDQGPKEFGLKEIIF